MTEDRKHELSLALHLLVCHNLWRRGHSDNATEPAALGKAIDTACGAMVDFMLKDTQFEIESAALRSAEMTIERNQKEIRRLRSILARHHVGYKEAQNK